ncbi:MAG: hypothetical protein AAF399_17520 [Bacteroidota bacterium]
MNKTLHTAYLASMAFIVVMVTFYLIYVGQSYYTTPFEERFYHPQHEWFEPGGVFGHGLGIFGTLMMLFGVGIYIARKRFNFLGRFIRLKYLLEFHIFLCTLGPILILFHTAFKFGGIVSVAFWSMVAVVVSGVIGRFIYIQIPRSIEGRELTLQEVKALKDDLTRELKHRFQLEPAVLQAVVQVTNVPESPDSSLKQRYQTLKQTLNQHQVRGEERNVILRTAKEEIKLAGRINRLETMQRLFRYWHVAHLPFALIMLVIVIFHVGVTLAFGATWIF